MPGQDTALAAAGVRDGVVPAAGRVLAERRAGEHTRAWKRRFRWRAGIEGRIHRLRRIYGLRQCRSHGEVSLKHNAG